MRILVIGGSGFVGSHLVACLGEMSRVRHLFVGDITRDSATEDADFQEMDVRKPMVSPSLGDVETLVNLAAVHKTPGHPDHEYFETNIKGAENVCKLAEDIGCNHIIFTSSIATYGPSEEEKTEDSLPMPNIPYGISKLVAEHIHYEWWLRDPKNRKLTIIRPAVVFGMGEKGNFTRIAKALRKKMFVYPGRTDTIKSCGYVKDIARLIAHKIEKPDPFEVYNFCYPEKITLERICKAFHNSLGFDMPKRKIPEFALNSASNVLKMIDLPILRDYGIHPARIAKLTNSTNISSQKLKDSGFEWKYDLESALKDWAKDCGTTELY